MRATCAVPRNVNLLRLHGALLSELSCPGCLGCFDSAQQVEDAIAQELSCPHCGYSFRTLAAKYEAKCRTKKLPSSTKRP